MLSIYGAGFIYRHVKVREILYRAWPRLVHVEDPFFEVMK